MEGPRVEGLNGIFYWRGNKSQNMSLLVEARQAAKIVVKLT
jgi:hypothetical protein